ncbi:cAMP-binding domain of CRP or a regulatory subunit of cAMP-dependent protein kinases [Dyadobacter soli]|uniref:cAMP-binding domain of CRP or a regulatory subunit of cAMP-dependent protein kinases n=1 Tax=Dyadobacter soli TaxID=659014 RepID=A0A1G7BB06_9BACT|nr:Crp/Fnr family transcriptional regulator [Dyadobacter soli]SDE24259.1 cAMP-binding domain of CRP or a regulatory subunit of cAMP-dependent protein kinases [Dyadobacter soli]
MYYEFISSLSEILPVEDQTRILFQQMLKIVKVPKGRILLAEGEVCDKLWYLQAGLIRGYHHVADGQDNFRDVTDWFASEGDFFHAADSFLRQAPSRECIETLESSVLIYISRADLYQLYANHPEACCIGRIIAERLLLAHQDLLRDMRTLSASEKLESFRTRSRELFNRVPQKYIASYLGISENYVSKLRAKR